MGEPARVAMRHAFGAAGVRSAALRVEEPARARQHAEPVQPAEPGRVQQCHQREDGLADQGAVRSRVGAVQDREDCEAGDEPDDPPQCRPMLGALCFYLAASRDVPGQDLC
jgi:hypothetical protein